MNNSESLTKEEVRGKRNTRTKTFKRTAHSFDDEKEVKGGRRGHGRMIETEYDPYEDLDDLDASVDWKKLLR